MLRVAAKYACVCDALLLPTSAAGAVCLVQLLDVQPEGLDIERCLLLVAKVPTALVAQYLHRAADFHLVAQIVGAPPVCAVHVVSLAALRCARCEGMVFGVVVLHHLPAMFASPSKLTAERDPASWT